MPWDANAAREVTEGSLDPLGPQSPQAVVISKLFREGAERLNRTACFQPARGGVASANEEPGDREIAMEEMVQAALPARRSRNVFVSLGHPQLPVLLVEEDICSL